VLPELFHPDGSTLLFLPLAHVFARLIQVGCVETGARMGHTADIKNLLADFATFQPTFILSVPRVFEKVYNTAKQKAHADGKGKIFDQAEKIAIQYSQAVEAGNVGLPLKLQHGLFDKLVYSKLRAALGGKVAWAVSGGAPLGARLGHFFRGIGVTILEGYGLTESSAAGTVNTPANIKIGTVGRPSPGVTVKIAEDGEILMSGEHILKGYWHNEAATAEAIQSGWFHTGDIGELDAQGFLKITGRKKELIVTAGGKNVAPAVLEDRLRAHPLVSQCLVVGDQQADHALTRSRKPPVGSGPAVIRSPADSTRSRSPARPTPGVVPAGAAPSSLTSTESAPSSILQFRAFECRTTLVTPSRTTQPKSSRRSAGTLSTVPGRCAVIDAASSADRALANSEAMLTPR